MTTDWIIGAQVSTSHTGGDRLTDGRVSQAIAIAQRHLDLSLLVVGAEESPAIFTALTEPATRPAKQVFLWYNLLSDVPGTVPSDLVVDLAGRRSGGWSGWSDLDSETRETFAFCCPNNPEARARTLGQLDGLLARYGFDGVFLDKLRFPSPASGPDQLVVCFCPHCRAAAAASDLDLDAVAEAFRERRLATAVGRPAATAAEDDWLWQLVEPQSLIGRFLRFRADCVTRLVGEAHALATRRGISLALDLFSPILASLVGQDYPALSAHAAWVKPMTYRVAQGPAGLKLEIPALVDGVAGLTGIGEPVLAAWCARHLPGFGLGTIGEIRLGGVPFDIMEREIARAIRLAAPAPIYFGIETVSYPGMIEVTPAMVAGMVQAGQRAGAAGTVLSWDLLYTPEENIQALAAAL